MTARLGFALLMALWLSVAGAAETVFYQPQNRDAAVTPEQWQGLFRALRREGTHTLIVQWTRYGGETFGGPSGWLDRTLQAAMAEGLDLVLGLYWDPDFFTWNREQGSSLAGRLNSYVRENLATARQWSHLSGQERIKGWYVPGELDDLNWQSGEKQAQLADALSRIAAGLAGTEPRPLAISAFFGGHMAPRSYAAWLHGLSRQGWRVWIQDGSGTMALTPAQRRIYLEALFVCPQGRELGLVVEAFRQTSAPAENFRARPATESELQAARQTYPGQCENTQATFSLRYLPLSRGILAFE